MFRTAKRFPGSLDLARTVRIVWHVVWIARSTFRLRYPQDQCSERYGNTFLGGLPSTALTRSNAFAACAHVDRMARGANGRGNRWQLRVRLVRYVLKTGETPGC